MSHVFISYSHQDVDFVLNMLNKLKEADINDYWLDDERLNAGDDWREAIDDAIRTSYALIVVITPDAMNSLYVNYEWACAWGAKIPIVPILLKKVEKEKIHPRLENWQYHDFTKRNARPWKRLIEQLNLKSLQNKAGEVPSFVKQSIGRFDDLSPEVRKNTIFELQKSDHPSVIDALAEGARHHLPDVRILAAMGLADKTSSQDKRALRGLLEGIENENEYAGKCSKLLFQYGEHAIPGLIKVLNAPWTEARKIAAKLLGDLEVHESVENLLPLLDDDFVRTIVMDSLAKIGDTSVIPAIVKFAKHESPFVREKVMSVLGTLVDDQGIIILIGGLEDNIGDVVNTASTSLVKIGDRAVESLVQYINDNSNESRRYVATYTLSEINHPAIIPILVEALDSSNIDIRFLAVERLGRMKHRPVFDKLEKKLYEEDTAYSIQNCLIALRQIDRDTALKINLDYLKYVYDQINGNPEMADGLKSLGSMAASHLLFFESQDAYELSNSWKHKFSD